MVSIVNLLVSINITASMAACCVLFMRHVMRGTPKVFVYLLWLPILFRLLCPFSFTKVNFVIPDLFSINEISVMEFNRTEESVYTRVENYPKLDRKGDVTKVPVQDVSIWDIPMEKTLVYIWIVGFFLIIFTNIYKLILLKRQLAGEPLQSDNIVISKNISSPFVLGIVKPRIFIPDGLNDLERDYILKHEMMHIKRKDYLVKPLFLLALAIHWFNPLLWLCFKKIEQDMEMACDESVIKYLDKNQRIQYSKTILSMAVKQQRMISCEGFGGGDISMRIKNILNYKGCSIRKYASTSLVILGMMVGILTVPQLSSVAEIDNGQYREFYNAVEDKIVIIEESRRKEFCVNGPLSQKSIDTIQLYYKESQQPGFIDMSIGERFTVTSFRG